MTKALEMIQVQTEESRQKKEKDFLTIMPGVKVDILNLLFFMNPSGSIMKHIEPPFSQ
jgi:hypothetical protein